MIAFLLMCAAVCSLASCKQPPKDTLEYTTRGSTVSSSTEDATSATNTPQKPEKPIDITGDIAVELEDGLTIYESVDLEKNAVRLVLMGDRPYYMPLLNAEYVVNAKYDLFQNSSGLYQAQMQPTETPIVVYLPVSEYLWGKFNEIKICWLGERNVTHEILYRPSLDVASYYPDEPIRMRDEFLHFALTEHFGGEYSERDLLSIRMLVYSCDVLNLDTFQRISNCIVIETEESDPNYDHIQYRYYYSRPNDLGNYQEKMKKYLILTCPEVYTDCEIPNQPVLVPDEAIADVERYFHGLYKIGFSLATHTHDGKLDKEAVNQYQEKYRLLAEQILKKKKYIATDIPMIGD